MRSSRFPSTVIPVLLALLLAISGMAVAQEADSEAKDVAQQVLRDPALLADAQACPALSMPKPEILQGVAKNKCKPGKRALCLKKCSAGNASACYWLANELQEDNAPPRAADALFQRACTLGIMSGCTNRAAGLLVRGRSDSATQNCAAQMFSRGCAADDPWACSMYGSLLHKGKGVPKNDDLALEVLAKSCKYGRDDPACSSAMALKAAISKSRGVVAPNASQMIPSSNHARGNSHATR